MNGKLSNVIIFAVGAAIGSAVTWKLLKTKYEQIANDEINEMREEYRDRLEALDAWEDTEEYFGQAPGTATTAPVNPDLKEYVRTITESDYNYEDKEDEDMVDKPYVISPDEFGDLDYDMITLCYFEDGAITDDQENLVEDPYGIIGIDPLQHFGEYEKDSVHVRNDALQCDYEILRDTRNYYDIHPEED